MFRGGSVGKTSNVACQGLLHLDFGSLSLRRVCHNVHKMDTKQEASAISEFKFRAHGHTLVQLLRAVCMPTRRSYTLV